MRNNPTGAMGLSDYLGRRWLSRLGLPIVNLPGCPVQPDNITETLLYLVLYIAHMGPAPELDEQGRPRRIFDRTVHEGCDRAGLAEEGQFSSAHGDGRCLVRYLRERRIRRTYDVEPEWRKPGTALTTGYGR
jgi:hydrogenase small subunit